MRPDRPDPRPAADTRDAPGCRVTRLSDPAGPAPVWSIAVFAHNEAGRIRAALDSIPAAAGGRPVAVCVLANGCTDATAEAVRFCAARLPDLTLVEIDLADKANAWNVYLHVMPPRKGAGTVRAHFFMDGDVRLHADALTLLSETLEALPGVHAAGGMPATGRDRDAWRRRMVDHGMLAGGLYALRGSFADTLRYRSLRLPVGFIGEDWLVSWLAASDLGERHPADRTPLIAFNHRAEFSFDSLSLARPADYVAYLRRKWRYALRALQYEMLMNLLRQGGLAAMPGDVRALYRYAPLPARARWAGWDTPWRLMALQTIRGQRRDEDVP